MLSSNDIQARAQQLAKAKVDIINDLELANNARLSADEHYRATYDSAQAAGWSRAELKDLGGFEPIPAAKKRRQKPAAKSTSDTPPAASVESANDGSGHEHSSYSDHDVAV